MAIEVMRPRTEEGVAARVAEAFATGAPLEISGAGTKREVGRPLQTAAVLSTERLKGITLYEPSELVLSASAGTRLSEVEKALAEHGQRLAFEPPDLGPVLGAPAGLGTIGAVFATNLSGPRRVLAGAARDHLIGVRAVNGRGEIFKSGGRVMKNVTGYDLARGLAGSWGTLAVMTEVTMKVLPRAEETRTLIVRDLPDEVAVEAMCAAMATPFEVSGAAHLPAPVAERLSDGDLAGRGEALTALRLENFSASVAYRAGRLAKELAAYGRMIELDDARSQTLWEDVRLLRPFWDGGRALWRLSIAPRCGARLVAAIAPYLDCRAMYDWSGGLIWLDAIHPTDAGATEVARAVAEVGGHATLIRAEPSTRAAVNVFAPLEPAVAALTRRVKAAFDPKGILNPGRMYAGV